MSETIFDILNIDDCECEDCRYRPGGVRASYCTSILSKIVGSLLTLHSRPKDEDQIARLWACVVGGRDLKTLIEEAEYSGLCPLCGGLMEWSESCECEVCGFEYFEDEAV